MVEKFKQTHSHIPVQCSVYRWKDVFYLLGDDHITSNTTLWYAIVSCNDRRHELVSHCSFSLPLVKDLALKATESIARIVELFIAFV